MIIEQAKRAPHLNIKQETEYINKWKETKDPKFLSPILESHQKLIKKIAKGYAGYGLSTSDLIAEGNIGMIHALKHFSPEKGFRFYTYAVWWVKASMKEFILSMFSIIRFPKSPNARKLFFKLRSELTAEEKFSISEESAMKISKKLDVPVKDILKMHVMLRKSLSLNQPIKGQDDGNIEWQDWFASDSDNEKTLLEKDEIDKRKKLLNEALKALKPREYDIFIKRRLKEPPISLSVIADEYDISRERVRQIEHHSYEKIKKSIKKIIHSNKN